MMIVLSLFNLVDSLVLIIGVIGDIGEVIVIWVIVDKVFVIVCGCNESKFE